MKTYDPDTGQVYFEKVTPVQSMTASWMNRVNRKTKDPKTYRSSGKGVTSLQEVALRHCVFCVFDVNTFEGLPWHIAEKIYDRLKDTKSFTVSQWKTFRTAYPSETYSNYRLSLSASSRSPPLQLYSISEGLKTFPFPCLTFLAIQDLSITPSDLISLILPIPNLAVLDIRPYHIERAFSSVLHDDGIDERGMRNWIRAIKEAKSLRDLKVLVLRLMDVHEEWVNILSDLFTELPSLQLLRVETKQSRSIFDAIDEENLDSTWRNWRRLQIFELPSYPEQIYSNPRMTTPEKLEELYKIPIGFQPPDSAPTNEDESNSISIAYGTPISVNGGRVVTSCSAWFIRNIDGLLKMAYGTETENKDSLKRGSEKGTAGQESKSKKRKVKEGKKSDIGALLGSFQGSS